MTRGHVHVKVLVQNVVLAIPDGLSMASGNLGGAAKTGKLVAYTSTVVSTVFKSTFIELVLAVSCLQSSQTGS